MMRMMLTLFGMSCLLLAQKIQVVHTERMDFPAGGLLRFKNSIGELTVEGWDRPDVEITTIKSTKAEYASQDREKARQELDQVRIAVEHPGSELLITTDYPRHRGRLPASLLRPATNFDLEYHVRVPINARLTVDHDKGEVHVDNLDSDMHLTVLNGAITLHLPQKGMYSIDAKSDFGDVSSDFPGREKRRPWLFGHRIEQEAPAAHKLYLRVGYGDITLLKTRVPGPLPAF